MCFSVLLCSRLSLVVFGRLISVSCLWLFMFVFCSTFFSCSHRFRLSSEICVVLGR